MNHVVTNLNCRHIDRHGEFHELAERSFLDSLVSKVLHANLRALLLLHKEVAITDNLHVRSQ